MNDKIEVLGEGEELVIHDRGRGRITGRYSYESKLEVIGDNLLVYRDKPFRVEKNGPWNKAIDKPSIELLGIVEEGPYENSEGGQEVVYREMEIGEELIEGYLENGDPEEVDLKNLLGWS